VLEHRLVDDGNGAGEVGEPVRMLEYEEFDDEGGEAARCSVE
jgi:hypothetical protein